MTRERSPRRTGSWRRLTLEAAFILVVVLLPAGPVARAQPAPDCGGVSVVAERAGAVVFRLPDQAGETFAVREDDELLLRAENVSSSGRVEISVRMPFGFQLAESHRWDGLEPGASYEVEVHAEDLSGYVRGAYSAEVAVFGGDRLLCEVPVTVRLGGFEGVVPTATAGAAGASGVAAVATAAWSASGARLKLRVRVAVRRRRRRGWRRWVPVPAWRRSVVSTVMGLLTGLLMTVVLQQLGTATLTTGSVISGSLIGGGATFGVGVVWGSVLTFIREPEPEEEEPPPPAPGTPAAPGGPRVPPPDARS